MIKEIIEDSKHNPDIFIETADTMVTYGPEHNILLTERGIPTIKLSETMDDTVFHTNKRPWALKLIKLLRIFHLLHKGKLSHRETRTMERIHFTMYIL